MAHSLSAKKRVRQNLKARARNRSRKELIKNETKPFLAALSQGDVGAAKEQLNKVVSRLDKVAAKNTIHRKAASRKRSRLTLRLNALVASGGKPAVETKAKGKKTAKSK